MSSITQDMKYCQSLRSYDPKYGVDRADCKATKAAPTSTSGVPATTVPYNPWPVSPDVRTDTPDSTSRTNLSLSLICTGEIPSWES